MRNDEPPPEAFQDALCIICVLMKRAGLTELVIGEADLLAAHIELEVNAEARTMTVKLTEGRKQ